MSKTFLQLNGLVGNYKQLNIQRIVDVTRVSYPLCESLDEGETCIFAECTTTTWLHLQKG